MSKRTTIYLDPKIHQAMKIKSAQSNRSISELISEAIQVALKQPNVPAKNAGKIKEPQQSYNVKNQRRRFTIVIEASEEGGYHAWCPSLVGCRSQGDTLQETKENIVEAIQCHLESLLKDGKLPPRESEEFVGSVEIPIAS